MLIPKIKNGQIVKLVLTEEMLSSANKIMLKKLQDTEKDYPALVVVSSLVRHDRVLYILADRQGKVIMSASGLGFDNTPFYISEEKLKPFNVATEMISVGGEVFNTNIPAIIIEKCLSKASLSRQIEVLENYAQKNGFIFQILEMDPYKNILSNDIPENIETSIKGVLMEEESTYKKELDKP